MVKHVHIYSLAEGKDADEFWKWHTQEMAVDVVKASGTAIKKYVINRVTNVIAGKRICYGFVENWWESEEIAQKLLKEWKSIQLPGRGTFTDAWWSQLADGSSFFSVEEYEVPIEKIRRGA